MSQSYEQFGKYLLLEKIAAGGMAEIYLARTGAANGLNKFFAIKRILPQFSTNQDFVAMFKEEAKVAINLNHSNVVSIFDFGIEAGQFYLVMDYMEGRNLRQIINELKKSNKSFSIDQALYLVKETAAGLDHAHRCTDSTSGRPLNITHRDMSPQNIMVSFEGEVKVIDFGIAKAETEAEDTKAGTLKGKFSYMSPEQAEGQPIDPRTDVFALGIVLWELLANDRLFTGSNEAAILRKVRDCQIPPIRKINPTVPPELERIVMKALAKDRNIRYQTAANFHRDLNRFLNTQYPDFSPQDFSQFVKESFKTAYQEGRDKLVTFSKIVVKEPPSLLAAMSATPPKPAVSAAAGLNAANPALVPPPTPDQQVPETELELPQVPNGLNAENNNVKINLEGIRASSTLNIKANSLAPGNAGGAPQAPRTQPASQQTRVTQVTQPTYSSKSNHVYNKKSGGLNEILVKVALLLALCVGGWWGYKNHYLPAKTAKLTKNLKENPKSTKGQTNQASVAQVTVSVDSAPTKAEIYIDGKSTKLTTPAVVTLTANREYEIMLHREGYIDYKKKVSFKQTSSLTASLQTSTATAYVNIRILESNSFTKVSVNGVDMLEKPPIINYPIVADKEITIRAYNPITQTSDERKVTAKVGEVISVELNLDKNKQQKK